MRWCLVITPLNLFPIVEELGRRGNQVVVVIPEASLSMGPSEHTTTLTYPVNYTKAELKASIADEFNTILSIDISTDLTKFQAFIISLDVLQMFILRNAEGLLFNKDLMKKLQEYNFDAILTDPFEPVGAIAGEYLSIPAVYMLINHPCGVDTLSSQCPSPFQMGSSYLPGRLYHRLSCIGVICFSLLWFEGHIETCFIKFINHGAVWLLRYEFTFEYPKPQICKFISHPKVKAFITHGGSHGIYEGICNGVPMVMLPLFGDQGDNVQRLVSRGVAESLSIYDLTAEKLLVALGKVINDKSYKEKITELSAIHRDRPIEPLDLAVFWTEFVMRHKGAAHLRPAAHELNWIQYHSLDVIGFLLLILVTVIFVTVKSCMFCFRKCFKKTQKKKKE
uniref:UDP-glucuronosyltransferase n=1 Tax=Sinocyclocheilus rhinocerous TaxID=307959 RepID=A0A673GCT0_9TELE